MEKKPWYLNIISGFSGQESSKRIMAIYTLIILVTGIVASYCICMIASAYGYTDVQKMNEAFKPLLYILFMLLFFIILLALGATIQDVRGFEQDILGKVKGLNQQNKSEENKQ